jgi:hypothetical protein
MASTSTNKQPLLVDRVLYESTGTELLASGSDTSIDIVGTNSSAVLVDCTTNDGAIIEDMFTIARGTSSFDVLFYMSSATDYLRANQAVFVGSITSATTMGEFTNVSYLPRVLAPVPQQGNVTGLPDGVPLKNQALYIPRGRALWVTLKKLTAPNSTTAPIAGVQGGFF